MYWEKMNQLLLLTVPSLVPFKSNQQPWRVFFPPSRETGIHSLFCPIIFCWCCTVTGPFNISFQGWSKWNIPFRGPGEESRINAASPGNPGNKRGRTSFVFSEQRTYIYITPDCRNHLNRSVSLEITSVESWLVLKVKEQIAVFIKFCSPVENNHPTCQPWWISKYNGIMSCRVPPLLL